MPVVASIVVSFRLWPAGRVQTPPQCECSRPRWSSGADPYKLCIVRVAPIKELQVPAFSIAPVSEEGIRFDGRWITGFVEHEFCCGTAIGHVATAPEQLVYSYKLPSMIEFRGLCNDLCGLGGGQSGAMRFAGITGCRSDHKYGSDYASDRNRPHAIPYYR